MGGGVGGCHMFIIWGIMCARYCALKCSMFKIQCSMFNVECVGCSAGHWGANWSYSHSQQLPQSFLLLDFVARFRRFCCSFSMLARRWSTSDPAALPWSSMQCSPLSKALKYIVICSTGCQQQNKVSSGHNKVFNSLFVLELFAHILCL